MGHDVTQVDPFDQRRVRHQLPKFAVAEAQPRHAGIDVDYRRHTSTRRRGEVRPRPCLLQVDQYRNEAVLGEGIDVEWRDTLQHEDIHPGQQGTQSDALTVCCREKFPAAGMVERPCNPLDTQAVTVGLDDGRAGAWADPLAAITVVGRQGVQVDGDNGAQAYLSRVRLPSRP